MNQVFLGDNLEIIQTYIKEESIDLIYVDPPFNSNFNYKLSTAPYFPTLIAFEDMWISSNSSQIDMKIIQEEGSHLVKNLVDFLSHTYLPPVENNYYLFMISRLLKFFKILKPTGHFYLHCDPHISHLLKIILDAIFGKSNFMNEIVWKRASPHNDTKKYGKIHDVILFYSKGNKKINLLHNVYSEKYLKRYRNRNKEGRLFTTDNLNASSGLKGGGYTYEWNGVIKKWRMPIEKMQHLEQEGRLYYTKTGTAQYIKYLDEMKGIPLQDIWDDIPPVNPMAKERLGYPTQKPMILIERIIRASTNEGDLVLDPFCGSGTTLEAANHLNRKWIGIDKSPLAIGIAKERLKVV